MSFACLAVVLVASVSAPEAGPPASAAGGARSSAPASGKSAARAADAAAQPAADLQLTPVPAKARAARRQRFVERLASRLGKGEKGVFLALGVESGNLDLPRQEPNFFYLSGVEVTDAALALMVGDAAASETLFLHEPTPRERIFDRPSLAPGRFDWQGRSNDPERQAALSDTGFKAVEAAHDLPARLLNMLDGAAVLFVAAEPVASDAPLSRMLDLAERLRQRHPGLRIVDARPDLEALRRIKEPAELARVEAAVQATLAGFRRAAAQIRPGALESTVQAEMEAGFRLAGAQRTAFATIAASGPRGAILHYMRNEGKLEAGELIVVDAGAERDGYAADVTRTFPVSGRFTDDQRQLYELVLEAQEAGIRAARPGMTLDRLDGVVKEALARQGQAEAMLHRCCHYVGLEVHDVGGRDTPLAEGMVITIEPGVYFPDRGFGIRIEDTFAVTAAGVRSLSGALPRRVDEVERFLSASRPGP